MHVVGFGTNRGPSAVVFVTTTTFTTLAVAMVVVVVVMGMGHRFTELLARPLGFI
jgi:hypothetical protein